MRKETRKNIYLFSCSVTRKIFSFFILGFLFVCTIAGKYFLCLHAQDVKLLKPYTK